MEVALYARISTKDKGQNEELQLEAMRKYCLAMGWTIFHEYVDKASASDLIGRTAWTTLMKDASLHKFDILMVWKLDRAFRSMAHASITINTLNAYQVGFRSLMDSSIDTTTPNGQLLFNVLASFAQFEKDLIVMRVNEGIKYAKEHGTKSGLPIGRKGYAIPFAIICKAMIDGEGVLSEAARILSRKFDRSISPGFVASRITRAGFTKEDILAGKGLQKVGQILSENHSENKPVN
jgi:DNA invertase Pin-like site-specific DNA recombinase